MHSPCQVSAYRLPHRKHTPCATQDAMQDAQQQQQLREQLQQQQQEAQKQQDATSSDLEHEEDASSLDPYGSAFLPASESIEFDEEAALAEAQAEAAANAAGAFDQRLCVVCL